MHRWLQLRRLYLDYSNILNTACETVREKTGYGVYVTAGSVATGDSTVTITPPKKR